MYAKWYKVLIALIGNPFGTTDAKKQREIAVEWFFEIRSNIHGWGCAEGGAMKDEKAGEINEYLVKVIRWVSKFDAIPRAHSGSGYLVKVPDVVKWVIMYRKEHTVNSASNHAASNRYVQAACAVIHHFLQDGEEVKAAIAAVNPEVYCGSSVLLPDLWRDTCGIPNRQPNIFERQGILDYCRSIDFDHEAVMRKEGCVVATKMEEGMFEDPFVD